MYYLGVCFEIIVLCRKWYSHTMFLVKNDKPLKVETENKNFRSMLIIFMFIYVHPIYHIHAHTYTCSCAQTILSITHSFSQR